MKQDALLIGGLIVAAILLFKDRITNYAQVFSDAASNAAANASNAALPTTYYSDYLGGNVQFEDWPNSWTTEAIKTGTVQTQLGTLDTLLSGRGWTGDGEPISGQVAYYNPVSGQAWGGEVGTMDWLYNSMDPAAVAWRARYG